MTLQTAHCKDSILNELAQRGNVAQFVSFGPDLQQRYAWVRGHRPNEMFPSTAAAVEALLKNAPEGTVNVRSFNPHDPKSQPFRYGLRELDEVLDVMHSLASAGLHLIVNETVDVNDGGVSGVAFGNIIEFTPGDTPRGVEKPGTVAFPYWMGKRIIRTVYGFEPDLPETSTNDRIEFSVHPLRRGYEQGHTIIWEREVFETSPKEAPYPTWPNNFSRLIGDKTFGLLVAHLADSNVPQTTAIPRKLAPFSFGNPTYVAEPWLRTAPATQTPGKFTTQRGWTDPYRLMANEDPRGDLIAAVLLQEGVNAVYSGALLTATDGTYVIEGVSGFGDEFMVGNRAPEEIPGHIRGIIMQEAEWLSSRLNEAPLRFEWVWDGKKVWVVQLHLGAVASGGKVVYPGEPGNGWKNFDVGLGLPALRVLVAQVEECRERGRHYGIRLAGGIGVTSHFGDVLRKARIPSVVVDV